MKKILFCFVVLVMVSCVIIPVTVCADSPSDEIENYVITVNMLSDGTMNMTYHIDWKVLNDSDNGPLTWAKIGIANQYVDNIKSLSNNISKIDYSSDNGDYIRIDFDKDYHAGDTVSFDFSVHQTHMYRLDSQHNLCTYSFTPGWFDDIKVKALTIKWDKINVQKSDAQNTSNDYLIWNTSLGPGDQKTISVEYKMGVFKTSSDGQADDQSFPSEIIPVVFVVICLAFSIFFVVIKGGGKNNYHGGFGTRNYIGGYHGHVGCACASSCACACACACAGGGRAGCTAKNLYGSVHIKKLKEKLQERL